MENYLRIRHAGMYVQNNFNHQWKKVQSILYSGTVCNNTEASLSIYRLSFKIKGVTQTLISLPLAYIKVYCIVTVNWKLTKTT